MERHGKWKPCRGKPHFCHGKSWALLIGPRSVINECL